MQSTGIQLRDHTQHEPRQMPLLQPVAIHTGNKNN